MSDALSLLVQGILMGIVIAMPVGPIALLTMKRTLQAGMWVGFATGLGAAVADTIYGAIAAFGVVAISDFLLAHQGELRILGGVVLLVVGIRLLQQKWQQHRAMNGYFTAKSNDQSATTSDANDNNIRKMALRGFASSLLLTMTNPITFIAFVAIMANIGIADQLHGVMDGSILVGGVFAGAALWWLSLALGVGAVKHLLSEKLIFRINVFAAFGLVLFGLYALISGFMKLNHG